MDENAAIASVAKWAKLSLEGRRPDLDSHSVPYDSESLDDLVDDELFIHAQDQLEILAYLDFLNDCRLYHDSILLDEQMTTSC